MEELASLGTGVNLYMITRIEQGYHQELITIAPMVLLLFCGGLLVAKHINSRPKPSGPPVWSSSAAAQLRGPPANCLSSPTAVCTGSAQQPWCFRSSSHSLCVSVNFTTSAFSTMSLQDPTWNMDTGATSHLNSYSHNLSTIFNKRLFLSIHVGDGNSILVTNTGHSIIPSHHRPLHLHNVLVTPNITKNLIFVRQFTKDNNCTIEFDAFGFSITDFLTRRILLRCDNSTDLYPVNKPSNLPAALVSTSSSTWHQRLGHPGDEVLRSLNSHPFISCSKEKSSHVFHAYQLGKRVKLPFHSSDSIVTKSSNVNLVRSMWLFKHKFHADGTLSHCKARLVTNGSNQQHNVEFDETFSPVVKLATIRTVLSLAVSRQWPIHQHDVKNAFLNGDLSETAYMHQPPGFIDSCYPNHACLCRGLVWAPLGLYLYASATTSLVGYTDADWAGSPSNRSCDESRRLKKHQYLGGETYYRRSLDGRVVFNMLLACLSLLCDDSLMLTASFGDFAVMAAVMDYCFMVKSKLLTFVVKHFSRSLWIASATPV
nr:ribonuclease H-like domain-containing protein [Tanacetum cinerariifolium]